MIFLITYGTIITACNQSQSLKVEDSTVAAPDHYKVEFENEYVRVVRVTYNPGEQSAMHSHIPLVGVTLTGGQGVFTDIQGNKETRPENFAGDVLADSGETHSVLSISKGFEELMNGKPESYSPFRPGMTATVDIITTRKINVIGAPISAIVIKEDTTSVKKDVLAELEKEVKEKNGTYKSDQKFECVFVKVGDKAKIRVVKTGIQDDTNIEIISGLKKGEEIIVGPYTTVSKDLSSNDKVKLEDKSKSKDKK